MTPPIETMTDEALRRTHNATRYQVALLADMLALPDTRNKPRLRRELRTARARLARRGVEVWRRYEAGKRLIAEQGLSGAEYEAAVRELAERLGV